MTDREYGLLLPLGDVPVGSRVTLRTGDKRYLVSDTIKVYRPHSDAKQQMVPLEIKADENTRFLMSPDDAAANARSCDTMVIWYADRYTLMEFLVPPEDK